jgi:hypothetical protein
MQARQKQVVEMLLRVHDYLGVNPPPSTAGYTKQKQTLDDIVGRLTGHTTDQIAGQRMSRAETQRQKALRRKLREEHLGPIAQIARAVLADEPGIEKALKLPSDSLSTLKYIAEANAMRAAAAKYQGTFVESGRPEDFIAQLDGAIGAVRDSLLGKARNVGTHVGAKAGLAKEIRRGRRAVQLIDTCVRSAFAGQADLLAKWKGAKRIQLVGTASASSAETPSAEPTADPSTVPHTF